ncbi:MAG: rRNA pseudouridine synthase [Cellvibrionaceae bacterium]
MPANRSRLDRFISRQTGMSLRDVKLLLSQQRIVVDGENANSTNQLVDKFSRIEIDKQVLHYLTPKYIMLNKPVGVVSATNDDNHTTVIDLIRNQFSGVEELHIPGRLDFNSSGLLLLTNDGRWSKTLSDPCFKVKKCYEVTLEKPIENKYLDAFAEGIYFKFEDIITQPAKLEVLSPHTAKVHLIEGRYHQIRRMFGYFQNKVLTLNRISVGNLDLDKSLKIGESRALTQSEVKDIF